MNRQINGMSDILAPTDLQEKTLTIAEGHRDDRSRYQADLFFPPSSLLQRMPNTALLYQRYLPAHDEPGSYDTVSACGVDFTPLWNEAQGEKEQKRVKNLLGEWHGRGVLQWFVRMAKQQSILPNRLLRELRERRKKALVALGVHEILRVKILWRTAAGVANPSPKENSGWAFHHTYGFPVFPAASLKGLLRHYLLEEVETLPRTQTDELRIMYARAFREWADDPEKVAAAAYNCRAENLVDFLLGSSAEEGSGGVMCFHDGWAEKDRDWFEVDVLTPHHKNFYAVQTPSQPPTDMEAPVPVHFLTLQSGLIFQIPLSLTAIGRRLPVPIQKEAVKFSGEYLAEALFKWGVGAKTGGGYGRTQKV